MTSLKKVNSTDLTPLPVPAVSTAVAEEAQTTVKQGYNDSNNDINTCVVCFKTVDIYSIGECDHPVCYECSARMRVLCRQNECPICRRELSQVIFTNTILPYRQLEINNRSGLYDKKFRVCFSSQYIQKSFNKLLDNSCPKCNAHGFNKFSDLKDHVRREHELFYCDICTDNLRIFSFERKCYNRQELGLHRRKGDPDNTSHRGHPLCQFCDCRYLDRDELFRHLRRNHLFCHLCDLDGCNQFYGCYDTLREHFRNEHYLCEEGDCFYENLTAVFRSEIDLKAHMSKQHSKSLGKVATRQARTLELEFTLAPRNRSGQGGGGGSNREGGSGGDQRGGRNRLHNYNQNNYNNEQQNENDIMVLDNVYNVGNQNNNSNNTNNNYSHSMNNEPNTISNEIVQNVNRKKVIDAQNEQEFPSLGGSSGNTNSGGNTTAVTLVRPNLSIRTKTYGPANLVKTKENFPALGSSDSSGTASPNFMSNNSNTNGGQYSQGSASSLLKKSNNKNIHTKKPQSGMVIHVSNRPKSKHMDSDFPALPGSTNSNTNTNNSQTITQSSKQQHNQNRYALAADMDALPKTQGQQNLLLNMNAIAAKHRSLVDEYVPMSSSYNAKLTLINSTQHKPQLSQQQQQVNDSFNAEPPRLNSKNNFPTLGGGSGRNNSATNNTQPQQWVMTSSTSSTETKQQAKKPKAITPSFNLNDYKTNLNTNNKKQNNNVIHKTNKDVAGSTSILTTSSSTSGGNNNTKKDKKKNIEKKENNNNNSNISNNNNKNIIKTNNNNNKKEKFNNNNNINENDIKAATATVTSGTKNPQVQEQLSTINSKNNLKSSSSHHQVQMKNLKINDTNSFPALGEMTNFYNSNITDKPSPAMIKPPPGFDNSNQNVVPPPGFNSVTLNSVARAPSNNLTFTNSLGESYSILPQHYYKPPTNSVKRNQVLVQHFQEALNSIEAMEQFRQISQMFREGDYMALPYYEHCRFALNSKFDEIFPELLTLLPDISKQQELYLVHSQYIKDNINDVKQRTMQQSLLDVCETCKQVLRAIDLQSHMQTHTLENNFPTLGGSSGVATTDTLNPTSGGNINFQKQLAWKK